MKSKITTQDFLGFFGESAAEGGAVSHAIDSFLLKFNFNFRQLDQREYEACLLEILAKLDSSVFDQSGAQRRGKWDKGWSENLQNFIDSGFDFTSLVPKYYRHSQISRYCGRLIATDSGSFQYDFFQVLRFYITKKFLIDSSNIFEFACGPGHNIAAMSEILGARGTCFHGLDWAPASVEIVNTIAERRGINCKGRLFDFFNPDYTLTFPANSSVLTFGGLEQIGENHERFLDFLISAKPALCINIEPIHELYDTRILLDYLANRYHHGRNYLKNYLSRLLVLEKFGKVAIEKVIRVPFGGMYHEGWSIIVWKPV